MFEHKNNRNNNRNIFLPLSIALLLLGSLIIVGVLYPVAAFIVMNTIWVVLFSAIVVFFALGVLVVLGQKKEVVRILEVFLEGSLSLLDLVDLLKSLWQLFLDTLKDFLIYAAPVFAILIVAAVYIGLLYLYKLVGSKYDVTLLTVLLTAGFVIIIAFLYKPNGHTEKIETWQQRFSTRFGGYFRDSFEILILIFFLTMDSTNLFFLPDHLNVPITAELGDYDLMTRGFARDNLRMTINIIMIGIVIEVIRNILKLIAGARKYFYQKALATGETRTDRIKFAVRKSFSDAKDDIIKFIAFTTILFLVFLFFPRLKLFTLTVASFVSLVMDLMMPVRLVQVTGEDMISRLLNKVLKLEN